MPESPPVDRHATAESAMERAMGRNPGLEKNGKCRIRGGRRRRDGMLFIAWPDRGRPHQTGCRRAGHQRLVHAIEHGERGYAMGSAADPASPAAPPPLDA